MYASRQRDVQPASTNSPSHIHWISHCDPIRFDCRVQALTGSHVRTVGPYRHWHRDGSIPSVGMKAARAAGKHPYPSRTRTLSPPAYRAVLEWATLWECRFAASPLILTLASDGTVARRLSYVDQRPPRTAGRSVPDTSRDRRPLGLSAGHRYYRLRQGGRVRPNAAACRAAHRRFKSGPWLSHDPLKPKTTTSWRLLLFRGVMYDYREEFSRTGSTTPNRRRTRRSLRGSPPLHPLRAAGGQPTSGRFGLHRAGR